MYFIFLLLFCSNITHMPLDEQPINVEDLPAFIQRLKESDPDLYALAQNESSGGQNLAHSQVNAGLNKGTTAGGPWGMMPLTAKEIVARNSAFKQQFPDIEQTDPAKITEILNNDPSTAYALAKAEYERRLKLMGGDKSRTAYSWLNGIGGTQKASPEDIISSEYVQKFLKNLPKSKVTKND
jgi:hypothetical protein